MPICPANSIILHTLHKYNREIVDYLKDRTTYSGYKYEGEYKHIVLPYIKDLIEAGLVEKV